MKKIIFLLLISSACYCQPMAKMDLGTDFKHATALLAFGANVKGFTGQIGYVVPISRDAKAVELFGVQLGYTYRQLEPFVSYNYQKAGNESGIPSIFKFGYGLTYWFDNPLSVTLQKSGRQIELSAGIRVIFEKN